jgi:hypothetical protein
MNAIVFDYDKTLGYFEQLHKIYILCNKKISIEALLILFPSVFRPHFFKIIDVLISKRGNYHIILYTNNNGPRYFIDSVIHFLNNKFNSTVFNHIIYGYSTSDGNKELCRMNQKKRFNDLLPCTGITYDNILFLDDCLHIDMIDERVEYLQVEPYFYNCYKELDILEKFLNKEKLRDLKNIIKKDIIPKSCSDTENIQIAKAIILYVYNLK